MIEYEITRAGYGNAYSRDDAIALTIENMKKSVVRRGAREQDVDWVEFARFLIGETIPTMMPDGLRYTIVLSLRFATEADAVYFKMQHGEHLQRKYLPDEHFCQDGVVAGDHAEDSGV